MAHRGELFGESPQACPFVALELDRDRRSDKPDYRHRCFAEPTPQPRAIAHQEAYCLSADFPACPIFQGWAMRAAAQPVPVAEGQEGSGASSTSAAGAGAAAAMAAAAGPGTQPVLQPPLPADLAPVVPAPGEPWPSGAFTPLEPDDAPRQMAAFDAPLTDNEAPAGGAEPEEALDLPPMPPPVPAAWSSPNRVADEPDEAPVPGFLAGRSEREPLRSRAVRPDAPFREKVTREDLIPSWDLTSRYGATVKEERVGGAGGGDRFGGLVTAVAVVAILALGVAGVIFLPGLLSGGHPATPTPPVVASPSLPPLNSASPFVTPTPGATNASSAVPSAAPEPSATPRLYRIKSGDQLFKIAKRFHVTVAQILAANPQITDPDHIVVGQVIVIPPRTPPAAATATP